MTWRLCGICPDIKDSRRGKITFHKFTSGHTDSRTEIKTWTQAFHFIISTLSNRIILAIDLYFSTYEREKKCPACSQTAAWRSSDNHIHKATGWMKRVFFVSFFFNLRSHARNGQPQNAGGGEEVTGLRPACTFFFFFSQSVWPAQVLPPPPSISSGNSSGRAEEKPWCNSEEPGVSGGAADGRGAAAHLASESKGGLVHFKAEQASDHWFTQQPELLQKLSLEKHKSHCSGIPEEIYEGVTVFAAASCRPLNVFRTLSFGCWRHAGSITSTSTQSLAEVVSGGSMNLNGDESVVQISVSATNWCTTGSPRNPLPWQ